MKPSVWIVLLCFFALTAYQCNSLRAARARLAATSTVVDAEARRLAGEQFGRYRADLTRAGMWLHAYYRSQEGLQRPDGLWIDGHPDFEGIAAWLFDVYLRERVAGASDEAARQRVVEAIQRGDEWQAKHRKVSNQE